MASPRQAPRRRPQIGHADPCDNVAPLVTAFHLARIFIIMPLAPLVFAAATATLGRDVMVSGAGAAIRNATEG
jgi:hypothetical protein